jgi:hypothetical protein
MKSDAKTKESREEIDKWEANAFLLIISDDSVCCCLPASASSADMEKWHLFASP